MRLFFHFINISSSLLTILSHIVHQFCIGLCESVSCWCVGILSKTCADLLDASGPVCVSEESVVSFRGQLQLILTSWCQSWWMSGWLNYWTLSSCSSIVVCEFGCRTVLCLFSIWVHISKVYKCCSILWGWLECESNLPADSAKEDDEENKPENGPDHVCFARGKDRCCVLLVNFNDIIGPVTWILINGVSNLHLCCCLIGSSHVCNGRSNCSIWEGQSGCNNTSCWSSSCHIENILHCHFQDWCPWITNLFLIDWE